MKDAQLKIEGIELIDNDDNVANINPDKEDIMQELGEFVLALNEKIKMTTEPEKKCLVDVMVRIERDMQKWIAHYEKNLIGFDEAYEEITSLHVFTEMYIK